MSRTDLQRIDIVDMHLASLQRHLARGDLQDELIFDAVCQRLASAIEEISGISPPALRTAFGDEWQRIQATRNAIAHNYQYLNRGVIQATIDRDLPSFITSVDRLRDLL